MDNTLSHRRWTTQKISSERKLYYKNTFMARVCFRLMDYDEVSLLFTVPLSSGWNKKKYNYEWFRTQAQIIIVTCITYYN